MHGDAPRNLAGTWLASIATPRPWRACHMTLAPEPCLMLLCSTEQLKTT